MLPQAETVSERGFGCLELRLNLPGKGMRVLGILCPKGLSRLRYLVYSTPSDQFLGIKGYEGSADKMEVEDQP